MATVDHLRADHRVTVLRDFTDANGISMHIDDSGVIRAISFDQLRQQILIQIERDIGDGMDLVTLTFPLRADSGPRNGNMREFFEVDAHAGVTESPGAQVGAESLVQQVIVPAITTESTESEPVEIEPTDKLAWWRSMRNTAGPDHQEDAEKEMLAEIKHIGVAGSIAEMYAQRMRAFRDEGNEQRAVAAFKRATDWMSTYASWATSGGEGAALSYERDQFYARLVKELGYDPTKGDK